MSEKFSALDPIIASEINQIWRGGSSVAGLLAGATINGATLPVAVYQNTSDNEFYNCDANDITKLNFVGFAISNSTDGNSIDIQFEGIVKGFTGLSEGVKYYVQDDGTIGTSIGTYAILVGIAISATELLIQKDIYSQFFLSASDVLQVSADTERTNNNTSYALKKSIQIASGGTIRIKFDIKTSNSGYGAYGKIYKNGVALGTEQSNVTETYQTKSEDLQFSAGDTVELWVKVDTPEDSIIRNFRIYYDKLPYVDTNVITD